jgi:hypothetical protein
VLLECHNKGSGGSQWTRALALASDKNIEVERIARRGNAFIWGSVPEKEDEVGKLQSGGKPNIISAGAND